MVDEKHVTSTRLRRSRDLAVLRARTHARVRAPVLMLRSLLMRGSTHPAASATRLRLLRKQRRAHMAAGKAPRSSQLQADSTVAGEEAGALPLTDDMLLEVLLRLPTARDVAAASATCRRLCRLGRTPALWRKLLLDTFPDPALADALSAVPHARADMFHALVRGLHAPIPAEDDELVSTPVSDYLFVAQLHVTPAEAHGGSEGDPLTATARMAFVRDARWPLAFEFAADAAPTVLSAAAAAAQARASDELTALLSSAELAESLRPSVASAMCALRELQAAQRLQMAEQAEHFARQLRGLLWSAAGSGCRARAAGEAKGAITLCIDVVRPCDGRVVRLLHAPATTRATAERGLELRWSRRLPDGQEDYALVCSMELSSLASAAPRGLRLRADILCAGVPAEGGGTGRAAVCAGRLQHLSHKEVRLALLIASLFASAPGAPDCPPRCGEEAAEREAEAELARRWPALARSRVPSAARLLRHLEAPAWPAISAAPPLPHAQLFLVTTLSLQPGCSSVCWRRLDALAPDGRAEFDLLGGGDGPGPEKDSVRWIRTTEGLMGEEDEGAGDEGSWDGGSGDGGSASDADNESGYSDDDDEDRQHHVTADVLSAPDGRVVRLCEGFLERSEFRRKRRRKGADGAVRYVSSMDMSSAVLPLLHTMRPQLGVQILARASDEGLPSSLAEEAPIPRLRFSATLRFLSAHALGRELGVEHHRHLPPPSDPLDSDDECATNQAVAWALSTALASNIHQ